MTSPSESPHAASTALHVQIGTHAEVDEQLACEIISLTLFDLGAQAVGESWSDGRLLLTAGFATHELAQSAGDVIRDRHSSFTSAISTEQVTPDSWVEAQRAGLEPTVVGPWTIHAPWHPMPTVRDQLYDVVIDPGTAFGHGGHASTRLAIELLLRHLTPEAAPATTVVDLGTGTGVAAIIAARLGATVRAVELDRAAHDVARTNIERNAKHDARIAERIELTCGDAAEARIEPTDLVLANVTLDVHRMIAKPVSRAQRIVTSGILCRQVRSMQDIYEGHWPSTIRTNGRWAAVDFSMIAALGRKN